MTGIVAKKCIVMLGPMTEGPARGGIKTVIEMYRMSELFERWPLKYIATSTGKGILSNAVCLVGAITKFNLYVFAGRVSLLHVHSPSRRGFWRKSLFVTICHLMRIPVIFHIHGAEFDKFYGVECKALRKKAIRSILGRCTWIVVLAERWQKYLGDIVDSQRVRVIHNPIYVPRYVGYRERIQEKYFSYLLFLGRYGQRKGIFDLLEAVEILLSKGNRIKLICAGDGDIETVRECVKEKSLEKSIHVKGWIDSTAREELLREAMSLVLPSYAEGLPMAILEAMAAGVPVVATNVGGIPDAIDDGVEGFLVSPGDKQGIVDAIEKLVNEPDLVDQMGKAAHQRAQRLFSVECVVRQIEELYESSLTPENGSVRIME